MSFHRITTVHLKWRLLFWWNLTRSEQLPLFTSDYYVTLPSVAEKALLHLNSLSSQASHALKILYKSLLTLKSHTKKILEGIPLLELVKIDKSKTRVLTNKERRTIQVKKNKIYNPATLKKQLSHYDFDDLTRKINAEKLIRFIYIEPKLDPTPTLQATAGTFSALVQYTPSPSSEEADEMIEADKTPVTELRPAETANPVAKNIAESLPSPSVHSPQQSEEHGTESPPSASSIIPPQPTKPALEPEIEQPAPESLWIELPLIRFLAPVEPTPLAESEPTLDLGLSIAPWLIKVVPATSSALVAQSNALNTMFSAMTQLSKTLTTHIINVDTGFVAIQTDMDANLTAA